MPGLFCCQNPGELILARFPWPAWALPCDRSVRVSIYPLNRSEGLRVVLAGFRSQVSGFSFE